MTMREVSRLDRRLRSTVLWGAIVLFAAPVSCSRASRMPLVEGTSVGKLRIDKATVADAARTLGVSADDARQIESGVRELRTPLFRLSFVPPADGHGPSRLYAARVLLQEDIYRGKTSKGIGFLDSVEAMNEAYGKPDSEWIQMNGERLHFYQQGVIFTTQHPNLIDRAIYHKARAALDKQPSDGPTAHVVTGIMVVRPFTVMEASAPMRWRQQVFSSQPKTDLLVSPH